MSTSTVNRRPLQPELRPWHLAGHMVSRAVAIVPLGAGTLALGMAMYHWVEGLAWPDAFLNAAMLLGGMGPVDPLHTIAGKWLAGLYALLAGVVFLVLAGVMLAPVVHHVLQRFHLEADQDSSTARASSTQATQQRTAAPREQQSHRR